MKKNEKINISKYTIFLIAIVLLGLSARVICCFWGWPFQLHPDEHTIVDNAIDMLTRHSWEANVYNRPDHFEIKCDAVIFNIVSWLRYKIPAYEAYEQHRKVFYLLARLFTAFWGTGLIVLSCFLVNKIVGKEEKKWTGLIAATFVAFSPIMVQHSAYATPDIPLAFCVVLLIYLSLFYLDYGQRRYLYGMCIAAGIAVTIKYPAAICCVYIAAVVIIKAIRDRNYKSIFSIGCRCIVFVLAVIFVIAPNLFTNSPAVVNTLMFEARNTHLGADGLGFFGNIRFYFATIMNSMGTISVLAFVLGVVSCFKSRYVRKEAFLMFFLYWIGMSVLALHWERWGIPIYLGYLYMAALGTEWAVSNVGSTFWKYPVALYVLLLFMNGMISTAALTRYTLQKDTRIQALEYCEEQGITSDDSVFEGYTPYAMAGGGIPVAEIFDIKEERLMLKDQYASKEYLIISSSFYDRYQKEPERYGDEIRYYDLLDENYTEIACFEATNYSTSPWVIKNIIHSVDYIFNADGYIGNDIHIYRLAD